MRRLRSSAALSLAVALHAAAGAQPAAGESCALDLKPDRLATPSSACMTCHDGSRALNAATGHRFDIAYEPLPGRGLRRDPEQFNGTVVLSEGRVTCLSCHDPASTLQLHLASPTGGDVERRLCVACHLF